MNIDRSTLSSKTTPSATKLPQESTHYLTAGQAAAFLGISQSTLYKMSSQRIIPLYKPGGKLLLFKQEELIEWVEKGKIISRSELDVLAEEHLRKIAEAQVKIENKKSHGANVANVKSLPGTRRH